jgi:hypothetical protein
MKNSINVSAVGTKVNVFLNGVLHTKDCGDMETANAMMASILKAKENPTDDAVGEVLEFMNRNILIARKGGLVFEPETGNVYLEGFNTPMPELLVDTIERYVENNFPVKAIHNFWKLLMANPDRRVREDLFKFIHTHDFSLTDEGYMVVYKAVSYMNHSDNDLASFVSNQYLHVKKDWGTSPNKYVVYEDIYGELSITKVSTFEGWDLDKKEVVEVGNLGELFNNIDNLISDNSSVFTDMYSHKMDIRLGTPVVIERKECDADFSRDCSYGLHVGATKYVANFGGSGAPVLVCLVNPMNVVAVPQYDHSKMRVCEYFPFALATRDDDGKIDIINQPYFEEEYASIEEEQLSDLLDKVRNEETEIALNAPSDERELDDIIHILESRVINLNV